MTMTEHDHGNVLCAGCVLTIATLVEEGKDVPRHYLKALITSHEQLREALGETTSALGDALVHLGVLKEDER